MYFDRISSGYFHGHALRDYPVSVGSEPLPFLVAGDDNIIGREIARPHPIGDYDYLGDWLLVECTHLAPLAFVDSWVKPAPTMIVNPLLLENVTLVEANGHW